MIRSPNMDWVATHRWQLLVGGELADSAEGGTFDCVSPVTGQVLCQLPDATETDVDLVVERATRAAAEWARVSLPDRARRVWRLAQVVRSHCEELAALDAVDVGNAYSPMLVDVENGALGMEFMADAGFALAGATLPATATHLHYTVREPFGVVARIVAFNHPIMFAIQKIAAPLVAGNAVILKPSEHSSLSALRMGEILAPHLPPGLLSVLTSAGAAMPQAIVCHPGVPRIGFIGSEPTGRAIQCAAAQAGLTDVTLELGGKNAMIICPDVDLDEAAASAVKGMNFSGWQSQSCSSTSRVFVHDDIADELVARIAERAGAIRIGPPLDPDTEMGTLASKEQYEKTLRYIDQARAAGARAVCGGTPVARADLPGGYYVEPTVFVDVDPDSALAREEVFGPVLSIFRWSDESELLAAVNRVRYGLTAAIWTNDLSRALRLASQVQAGYVWINDAATHFTGVPFGGQKASGIGREESVEELQSYTQLKSINIRLDHENRDTPATTASKTAKEPTA